VRHALRVESEKQKKFPVYYSADKAPDSVWGWIGCRRLATIGQGSRVAYPSEAADSCRRRFTWTQMKHLTFLFTADISESGSCSRMATLYSASAIPVALAPLARKGLTFGRRSKLNNQPPSLTSVVNQRDGTLFESNTFVAVCCLFGVEGSQVLPRRSTATWSEPAGHSRATSREGRWRVQRCLQEKGDQ